MAAKKIVYSSALATVVAVLIYLSSIPGVRITTSGDITCSVCTSYFNITSSNYSLKFYKFDQRLTFSPEIKNYTLYRYTYGKWRETKFPINMTKGTLYRFKLVGYKFNPSDKIKWAISSGDAEIDPYWLGEKEVESNPNIIGEVILSPEIRIESQDYIDEYFDWSFTQINDTYWMAEFVINNQNLLNDVKIALPYANSNTRWKSIRDIYFPNYTITRIANDFKNMTNYPLESMSSSIKFSNLKIDLPNGKGSFYLIFPDGFKENERAKLGFGTTQINTGANQGTSPEKRSICNSNTMKHVVWKYNTTHIFYANTSLSGNNGWTVNQSFYTTSASQVFEPSMDCYGNNVTIGIPDTNLDILIVMSSVDNGASFTKYTPITGTTINQAEMSIQTRGSRIYIINYNDSADEYMNFVIINNADGSVIQKNTTIFTLGTSTAVNYPMSMTVNGTGDTSDIILISFMDDDDDDVYAINSTDGGTTFGSAVLVQAGTWFYCSITHNVTHQFISYSGAIGTGVEYATLGATWTSYTFSAPGGDEIEGSLTINELNKPTLFFTNNQYNTNQDIVFSKLTSGTAFDAYTYLTNDSSSNRFVNTKMFFDNNKLEWIWRRNNSGLFQMWYDYLSFTGEPNVLGVPFIFNKTISITNCSALYNGATNGRMEYIWYLGGILQKLNGSTANTITNLTKTYTSAAPYGSGNWTCSARAYNGSAYSGWVNSTTVNGTGTGETINPTWSLNQTNSTVAGSWIKHSLNWTDNVGLSGYIFNFCNGTWNGNCGWVNDTWVAFNSNTWSNVSKIVNSTTGAHMAWGVYANDTSNNWNASSVFTYDTTAGSDSTPPTFSSYSANTTIAGMPVNISVKISDEIALSGYIFETNNTGTFKNTTWGAMASGGTAQNITTLNTTMGITVNITFYANDSSNNWGIYRATLITNTTYIGICQVLNQAGNTYYLTEDIIDSDAATCMDIQNDNITLDCQGHTIDGNSINACDCIFSDNVGANVIVDNCIITDWICTGAYIASFNTIKNSVFVNNNIIMNNDNNTVINTSISFSTSNGGIQLSSYNNIVNVTVFNNMYGLYSDSTNNNTITNSNIFNNTYGVYSVFGYNDTLYNNIINNNSYGIYLTGPNNIIYNNTILLSSSYGIYLLGSNNTFCSNKISDSGINGIYIEESVPNAEYVQNNTFYNNMFNNTVNVGFCNLDIDYIACQEWEGLNYWNTTQQSGTRIYSDGTQIGGNYWTNSTNNEYSDTCTDSDCDGFCDSPLNITNTASCTIGVDCGDNVDYISYSDEYIEGGCLAAECWAYESTNKVLIIPSGCVYHNDTVGII